MSGERYLRRNIIFSTFSSFSILNFSKYKYRFYLKQFYLKTDSLCSIRIFVSCNLRNSGNQSNLTEEIKSTSNCWKL